MSMKFLIKQNEKLFLKCFLTKPARRILVKNPYFGADRCRWHIIQCVEIQIDPAKFANTARKNAFWYLKLFFETENSIPGFSVVSSIFNDICPKNLVCFSESLVG